MIKNPNYDVYPISKKHFIITSGSRGDNYYKAGEFLKSNYNDEIHHFLLSKQMVLTKKK